MAYKHLFRNIGLIFIFLQTSTAYAYIGPGAGLSAIGSFLALVIALIVALIAFVWFPLKRWRNKKLAQEEEEDD